MGRRSLAACQARWTGRRSILCHTQPTTWHTDANVDRRSEARRRRRRVAHRPTADATALRCTALPCTALPVLPHADDQCRTSHGWPHTMTRATREFGGHDNDYRDGDATRRVEWGGRRAVETDETSAGCGGGWRCGHTQRNNRVSRCPLDLHCSLPLLSAVLLPPLRLLLLLPCRTGDPVAQAGLHTHTHAHIRHDPSVAHACPTASE